MHAARTDTDTHGGDDAGAAAWMRAEMGRELARRRQQAGLTQEDLAARTGRYSRSTVSLAELGKGRTAREFWRVMDRLLGTGGLFAGLDDEVRRTAWPGRREAVLAGGSALGCELALKSAEPDRALAAYRRLGWPAARGDVAELVTGKVADVLEIGRPAGVIAAGAWLETGGAESAARGLPALPAPEGALAVIEAGERWFFLVSAGGFPWQTSGRVGRMAGGEAEILWHSVGSRVPLPPSKTGLAAARWAYLPTGILQLAPPLAVLGLLGWAAAMACVPGKLRLPGGAVVTAAGPRP